MFRLLVYLLSASVVLGIHLQNSRVNTTVKDVLNAACPNLPTAYITNLEASNWIYGGIHPAEYNHRVEELRDNNKVVKCLSNKPYFNGTECIGCTNN